MTSARRAPVSRESATARGPVTAAGAVVWGPGRRVLLVHRPKYDDWSFPKGKVERGEHVTATAVREIAEETGVRVRLGVPLDPQHYPVLRGDKTVHYWVARPCDERRAERAVEDYRANAEVDRVAWVDLDRAHRRLTHPHDRLTLEQAAEQRRRTRTLLVVRHGAARSRRLWREDDRRRPLLATGHEQARRLVAVLAAYDVRHLLSSSSTRCVQTLAPYAEEHGWAVSTDDRLSEEDATPKRVRRVLSAAVEGLEERSSREGALAVCSHRPVLPGVCEAVGVPEPHPRLATAEVLVVHRREGRVVAVERHGSGIKAER